MEANDKIYKEMEEKYIKDMAIAGLSEYSVAKLLAWVFYREDDRPPAQNFFTKGAEREIARRIESLSKTPPLQAESVSDEEIENEFPYKHKNGFIDYEFQGKIKAAKWMRDRLSQQ